MPNAISYGFMEVSYITRESFPLESSPNGGTIGTLVDTHIHTMVKKDLEVHEITLSLNEKARNNLRLMYLGLNPNWHDIHDEQAAAFDGFE